MSEDKEKESADGRSLGWNLISRVRSFVWPHTSDGDIGDDIQNIKKPFFDLGLSKTDHTICFRFQPELSEKLLLPIYVWTFLFCFKTHADLQKTRFLRQNIQSLRPAPYRWRSGSTSQPNKPKRRLGSYLWNLVAIPSVGLVSVAVVAAAVDTHLELKPQLEGEEQDDDEDESAKTTTFPLDWRFHEELLREGGTCDVHSFLSGGHVWKVALKLRAGDQLGFYVTRRGMAQMPFTIRIVSKNHGTVLVEESFGDWGSSLIDGKGPCIPMRQLQDSKTLEITVRRDGPVVKTGRSDGSQTLLALLSMLQQMSE